MYSTNAPASNYQYEVNDKALSIVYTQAAVNPTPVSTADFSVSSVDTIVLSSAVVTPSFITGPNYNGNDVTMSVSSTSWSDVGTYTMT